MTEDYPLEPLLEKISGFNPDFDRDLVTRAYWLARNAHEGQKRKSGEPYFVHIYAVGNILADLHLDTATIAAGLLHDTVEDTDVTIDEIESAFNADIRRLVYGVTKIGQYKYNDDEGRQAENFRNLVLVAAQDIRVVMIKLADRLHNMRTLHHVPEHKQQRIARETQAIYAPFANRLGMSKVKSELEDLSFRYTEPDKYEEIRRHLARGDRDRNRILDHYKRVISEDLERQGMEFTITGRPKHLYSIYKKMQAKDLSFDEIYDLIGLRVITKNKNDCWRVIGSVHSAGKPINGRFKDYIANPKPNGYQSIHTAIIGPDNHAVEVQIRSEEMHAFAEQGVAAHWIYKERDKGISKKTEEIFSFVSQFTTLHKDVEDSREFLREAITNILADSVFVRTPKNEVRSLPKGATAIDFAYDIHTDIGNTCAGARVNGILKPLTYKLSHGDVVEIICNKSQRPRSDWLQSVKTLKARQKINQFLKQSESEVNVQVGIDILNEELRPFRTNYKEISKHPHFEKVLEKFSVKKRPEDLLALLALGKVKRMRLISRLKSFNVITEPTAKKPEEEEQQQLAPPPKPRHDDALIVDGVSGMLMKFAKCCLPVQGDDVCGIVTKGRGVSIHRADCPNANAAVNEYRRVPVAWGEKRQNQKYETRIQVIAHNRMGLAADINQTITNSGVNMTSTRMDSIGADHARGEFTVIVKDVDELDALLRSLRQVRGVSSAGRAG